MGLDDGRLLEAVNEERFNREKLYVGLPERSLQYVLERHRLALSNVDYFAYGWYGRETDYGAYAVKLARRVERAIRRNGACGDILENRIRTEFERDGRTRLAFERWLADLGVPERKVLYLDHHTCHAWAAFACSPFEAAAVFTFDGRGDLKSTTASVADREHGVRELDYLLSMDSLGFLYGQVTHYLGFKPTRHEGKVTGLAAYGDPRNTLPLFQRLIAWEDDSIVAQIGPYKPFYTQLLPELTNEFAKFSREDLAAGLQQHCEDLVVKYIRHWLRKIDRPDLRNICLAGGVCANVKINQRVAELPGVDNVFIFPHMGDGGLPVGSACYAQWKLTGHSKVDLPTVYLGPAYDDDQIRTALDAAGDAIHYVRMANKVESVVRQLVDEKVVGFFDGRMEYGPRALGARSILYHARDRTVNDWLNKRMRRTEFMPFAPVTPAELAAGCYVGWNPGHVAAEFMTRTYTCTQAFAERHVAVVHVDGTARPQIVSEAKNGDYYRIVTFRCKKDGLRPRFSRPAGKEIGPNARFSLTGPGLTRDHRNRCHRLRPPAVHDRRSSAGSRRWLRTSSSARSRRPTGRAAARGANVSRAASMAPISM